MAATKIMNDLTLIPVQQEDRSIFERLIGIVDNNYPQHWRSWEVEDIPYTDLFGSKISSQVEAKLRFAIPTSELTSAFTPDDPTLSEKKFRAIKRKLLDWPLGRALIYSPHSIMEKIHRSSYSEFMHTVKLIKSKLTSRDAVSGNSPKKRHSLSPSSSSAEKTPRREHTTVTDPQISLFEKMMQVLSYQTKAIESVAEQMTALNAKNNSSRSDSPPVELDQSFESVVDSTQGDDFEAPSLNAASPENQTEISNENDIGCDFSPCTVETEPKYAKADPQLAEQGRKCQRLGEDNWKNVRYSDVQKTFHATPVFSALKVNSLLAPSTPTWTSLSQLEKMDTALGAITHGLLLQRQAFQEACKKLDVNSQREIQKNFLNPECNFRKLSDNLLQYTCGRRAEVIQLRRDTYKSQNKVLNEILHDIPPSETHLFSEQKLTEAVKDQGGVHKFFPKKTSTSYKNDKKTTPPTTNRPFRQQQTHGRQQHRKTTSKTFRPSSKHASSSYKARPQNNPKKS